MKVIYKEEKREFAKEYILTEKERRIVEAANWVGEVKALRVCFRHPESGETVCKMIAVEQVEWILDDPYRKKEKVDRCFANPP